MLRNSTFTRRRERGEKHSTCFMSIINGALILWMLMWSLRNNFSLGSYNSCLDCGKLLRKQQQPKQQTLSRQKRDLTSDEKELRLKLDVRIHVKKVNGSYVPLNDDFNVILDQEHSHLKPWIFDKEPSVDSDYGPDNAFESYFDDVMDPNSDGNQISGISQERDEGKVSAGDNRLFPHVIPWQYFITDIQVSLICPCTAINARFLLASQTCLRELFPQRLVGLYVLKHLPTPQYLAKFGPVEEHLQVKDVIYHQGYRRSQTEGDVLLPLTGKTLVQVFWSQGEAPKADPIVQATTIRSMRAFPPCRRLFSSQRVFTRNRMCSIMKASANCQDHVSGGALSVFDQDTRRHSLVGIFSFGGTTCNTLEPQVFSSIEMFMDWIVMNIQSGECANL
ncbi:uncharacterized protein LOC131890284 isoform X2 [Tigriopus californicus]|uniref:uncharacterized protein LOC131890284 isoform X2 n=1 Tax=Tigriopus californicus TaxID=6832 RepID=UPI0027DA2B95|nr:uncharacterized protein LOC131890284 isoform X2 [Tigriopus californicus]